MFHENKNDLQFIIRALQKFRQHTKFYENPATLSEHPKFSRAWQPFTNSAALIASYPTSYFRKNAANSACVKCFDSIQTNFCAQHAKTHFLAHAHYA